MDKGQKGKPDTGRQYTDRTTPPAVTALIEETRPAQRPPKAPPGPTPDAAPQGAPVTAQQSDLLLKEIQDAMREIRAFQDEQKRQVGQVDATIRRAFAEQRTEHQLRMQEDQLRLEQRVDTTVTSSVRVFVDEMVAGQRGFIREVRDDIARLRQQSERNQARMQAIEKQVEPMNELRDMVKSLRATVKRGGFREAFTDLAQVAASGRFGEMIPGFGTDEDEADDASGTPRSQLRSYMKTVVEDLFQQGERPTGLPPGDDYLKRGAQKAGHRLFDDFEVDGDEVDREPKPSAYRKERGAGDPSGRPYTSGA